MQRFCLVSACLTCACHGRRVQAWERLRSSEEGRGDTSRSFASLLSVLEPAAAFTTSSSGASSRRAHPSSARRHTRLPVPERSRLYRHSPVMSQYANQGEDRYASGDPSVPRPGTAIPEKDTILRGLRVAKVSKEGCFLWVDEPTNLQGFVFSSGLDSGYFADVTRTFKVGDILDVKVIGVSTISGRLMLSRKILMDEEGPEKHRLPDDGRELPTSNVVEEKKETGTPSVVAFDRDPAKPAEGAIIPVTGAVLRDRRVVNVTKEGVFIMADEDQGLQGFNLASLMDTEYVRDIFEKFKPGDKVDVKVMGVSAVSGRLMLSRKAVLEEDEGTGEVTSAPMAIAHTPTRPRWSADGSGAGMLPRTAVDNILNELMERLQEISDTTGAKWKDLDERAISLGAPPDTENPIEKCTDQLDKLRAMKDALGDDAVDGEEIKKQLEDCLALT